MHVLLLNQAFYPDIVSTAQMSRDLADVLVRRGHKVTAVASRSIYGSKGAVLPKAQAIDGIEIRRVGASLFGKTGYAARAADFALFHILAAGKVLTGPRPDAVVSFTTPPFIAAVGLLNRALRGSRAVYWVMDLYPDVAVACDVMKEDSLKTRFFERLNRFLLRRSDADVVLGRCMRDRVIAKGTPAERVHEIPVWADTSGIQGIARDASPYRSEWGLGDAFTVMYSGNFGIGHETGTICRAMLRLRDRDDIRFVFVGGGKRREEVEAFIRDNQLPNAVWHEYVPRDRLGESLAAADVHLISLKEGVEGIMVPSKLFGNMASARPSIYIGHPSSEIARVLDETHSGLCVREGDDAGLVDAILRIKDDPALAADMGARARREMQGRFDRDTAAGQFVDLLESLTGAPRQSPIPDSRSAAGL